MKIHIIKKHTRKKAFEYIERAKVLKDASNKKNEDKQQPISSDGKPKKEGEKDDPDAKLKETLSGTLITEKT